jgi:hypothetical protein
VSDAARLLRFELAGAAYALRLADVRGVVECGTLRGIPRAPAAVLGVTEWRGNLLTVVDLPRLLGHASPTDRGLLVRLAPPLAPHAFSLPPSVRVASAEDGPPALAVLDVAALLRGLERGPGGAR